MEDNKSNTKSILNKLNKISTNIELILLILKEKVNNKSEFKKLKPITKLELEELRKDFKQIENDFKINKNYFSKQDVKEIKTNIKLVKKKLFLMKVLLILI